MPSRKGLFITVEGIDGSGKSTLIQGLTQFIASRTGSVITTREPGGTPLAERVRALLLDPCYSGLPSSAELLLFGAGRADHVERVIRPALDQGTHVLCSRFSDATFAYQVAGRGLPESQFQAVCALSHSDVNPDLTLVLDLPVHLALERVAAAGSLDRIEAEKTAFFERVRGGYLDLVKREPERFRVLDAADSPEAVLKAAQQHAANALS